MNKLKFATTVIIAFGYHLSNAQLNNFTLSQSHARKIEQITSGRERLKKYHKYFHRDSIKQARQLERYWQAQEDSMRQVIIDEERIAKGKSKKVSNILLSKIATIERSLSKDHTNSFAIKNREAVNFSPSLVRVMHGLLTYYCSLDSQQILFRFELAKLYELRNSKIPDFKNQQNKLGSLPDINIDKQTEKATTILHGNVPSNLQNNMQVNQGFELNSEFKQYGSDAGKYNSSIQNPDIINRPLQEKGSALATKEFGSRMGDIGGLKEIQNSSGEIQKLKDIPNGYKNQVEQYTDSAYVKEQAKKKAEEMAMNYLNSNPEILRSVQAKMKLLTKTYSVIPNSNDLSTAIKRNSLKGKSFKERLYFSSNFQVLTLQPVSIDFSPMVGYKFNSKFVVGIGGMYRKTFSDTIPALAPKVWGYKGFASYDVLQRFFAYTEYDQNTPGMRKVENNSIRIWKTAWLVGVGRKLTIHPKIQMTLLAAYNIVYQKNDPIYSNPWVVRVGFQTNELSMLKR